MFVVLFPDGEIIRWLTLYPVLADRQDRRHPDRNAWWQVGLATPVAPGGSDAWYQMQTTSHSSAKRAPRAPFAVPLTL